MREFAVPDAGADDAELKVEAYGTCRGLSAIFISDRRKAFCRAMHRLKSGGHWWRS